MAGFFFGGGWRVEVSSRGRTEEMGHGLQVGENTEGLREPGHCSGEVESALGAGWPSHACAVCAGPPEGGSSALQHSPPGLAASRRFPGGRETGHKFWHIC